MKKSNIVWLCESAIMLALAFVLSMIKVVDPPYGGSVTAGSMVPIAIVAYRYGFFRGTFTALVYSALQLLTGLSNLSYATSWYAALIILLFDYIVAFGVIGVCGAFGKIKNSQLALTLGTAVACALRYVCHVISGCTVWRDISIPYDQSIVFSIGYNATYMIPETIVSVALVWYLSKMLDFRELRIGASKVKTGKAAGAANALAALFILGVAVFDAVELFVSTQTESGFDIRAAANAPFALMGTVTAVGVGLAVISALLGKAFGKKC